MASHFDPTRFIEAEQSQLSQTIAGVASDFDWPGASSKTAKIRHSSAPPRETIATIATIADPADENLPWAAELTSFVGRHCPDDIRPSTWTNLLEEAWDGSRLWGAKALALGWRPLDLFGCNPDPRAGRLDRDGLVVLNAKFRSAVHVTAITDLFAEVVGKGGSIMRYRPPVASGAVFLWDAYPQTSGP